MAKFKVGDIVVGNEKANALYGITTEGSRLKVTKTETNYFYGKLLYSPFCPGYIEKEFTLDYDRFDLFENKKIVITKRDDSVMARLYSAEKLVKETNVDSTGDFNKDAKDAVEELYYPTKFTFSFDEVKHLTAKIYETISYKEFRWDDFIDGETAIKVSSNKQLEEILDYFYRRYPGSAGRPVVMFDLKNFDDDFWGKGIDYYIYVLDGRVYIGQTNNLYVTDVTKIVKANELWTTHSFTSEWDSFIKGFTALYFDEDNIDKILYTLNCKGYTWMSGGSPIPTEYKPPVNRGYICMRNEHITWCSESQTKEMFEDETSHITEIVRPR